LTEIRYLSSNFLEVFQRIQFYFSINTRCMDFLHKESTGEIQVLTQSGEKSSFVLWWNISGHLKPYSLEDQTFDVSWISWSLYKLTLKNSLTDVPEMKEWYKLSINTQLFVVRAVREYSWITFQTKKILLSKES
jgi:hypothetical protein